MRACARVALASIAVSASFSLSGCAAIEELKETFLRWVESQKLPSGRGVSVGKLPEATPVVPPRKTPKEPSKRHPQPKDVGLSTTLADFSRARDSQISFSVTHGWSAFWRGRPWLAGHRIGETSSDVGSSRFWIGWVTKHDDKCARSTCRD